MWRLLVTPKWVALTGALLVVVAAFGWLGFWQWNRAHREAERVGPGLTTTVRPVASLARPGQPLPDNNVGRPVSASGRYDPDEQLLVPRVSESRGAGFWVLTPLVEPNGSVLPVVRGWSSVPGGVSVEPPTGVVKVVGELAHSEDSGLRSEVDAELPDGQVAIVSTAELLSLWEGDLYPGYLLLSDQDPQSRLTVVDAPTEATAARVSWQSLAYSVQWWLFAAFAVFFWWRVLLADRTAYLKGARP